jgi:hypothetical protein
MNNRARSDLFAADRLTVVSPTFMPAFDSDG